MYPYNKARLLRFAYSRNKNTNNTAVLLDLKTGEYKCDSLEQQSFSTTSILHQCRKLKMVLTHWVRGHKFSHDYFNRL